MSAGPPGAGRSSVVSGNGKGSLVEIALSGFSRFEARAPAPRSAAGQYVSPVLQYVRGWAGSAAPSLATFAAPPPALAIFVSSARAFVTAPNRTAALLSLPASARC